MCTAEPSDAPFRRVEGHVELVELAAGHADDRADEREHPAVPAACIDAAAATTRPVRREQGRVKFFALRAAKACHSMPSEPFTPRG